MSDGQRPPDRRAKAASAAEAQRPGDQRLLLRLRPTWGIFVLT